MTQHLFKRLIAALSAVLVILTLTAAPAAMAKDPFGGVDCSTAQNSAACTGKSNSTDNPLTGPNGTIRRATGIVARIAGIAAVIVIMIGGYMYITAGGDSGKVGEAKNAIIYASVGLAVIALAQYLIIFILSKF